MCWCCVQPAASLNPFNRLAATTAGTTGTPAPTAVATVVPGGTTAPGQTIVPGQTVVPGVLCLIILSLPVLSFHHVFLSALLLSMPLCLGAHKPLCHSLVTLPAGFFCSKNILSSLAIKFQKTRRTAMKVLLSA